MPHRSTHHQVAAANQGKIGLIDVGSNSVRFVVYDRLKRAPYSIYNEKVMCRLGSGLAKSGKLNPSGVKLARKAIARFVALAKNMEVTELDIIATAAMREASDGQDFADELERKHNVNIEVISGRREAKLAAYGVLSSIHQPRGMVADLGGGSLELAWLDENSRISNRVSMPIGVLRLMDECSGLDDIRQKVRATLSEQHWISNCQGGMLYAVGGSFRNVARIHMHQTNHPLTLVHGYEMGQQQTSQLLEHIRQASADDIAAMPGVSSKRADILPIATVILEELLRALSPEAVTYSNSGIREGYLYRKLSPFIRSEDVTISACVEVARGMHHSLSYAKELYEWMERVLNTPLESEKRLAYPCCTLQDIARYINPEDRAAWAYERVMQSNLMGLTHKQRTQLALALYHCYSHRLKHEFAELTLLDENSRNWAQLVGTIASLAHHLAGGVAGTLPKITLNIGEGNNALTLPDGMEPLHGNIIDKRLASIVGSYQAWQAYK